MNRHHLLPVFQSAYRPNHSTETALARIMNDMILVVDDGRVGALTLLDLSAAFDTVDHSVLSNECHVEAIRCVWKGARLDGGVYARQKSSSSC